MNSNKIKQIHRKTERLLVDWLCTMVSDEEAKKVNENPLATAAAVKVLTDGKEIKSDAEFDKYADEVLKQAHPDDFDEKIAKKVKDGVKKKYKDDYGAAVGALSSGIGK